MSTPMNAKLASFLHLARGSRGPLAYPYTPADPPTGLVQDVQALGFKDYETLLLFLNTAVEGVNNDDKHLVERLVELLSKLPPHSREMKTLSHAFINRLWTTLGHPPVSSLADIYRYRRADGSYNNINAPQLGAANTPYARSVTPAVFQNPDLPDADLVFEKLMARTEKFEPHPQGISSMLFYLATLIIHDIFQTSSTDNTINMTSSYLDLSPLYGRNDDEVKMMRTFNDGRLKSDCFSSGRIIGFPPGCGVFLVMFNRFHNYVVTRLAVINESGRFTKPHPNQDGQRGVEWTKYDEDLFQTGRLITCGLYVNIILKDYVRTILALNRNNSAWSLDPRGRESRSLLVKPVPQGVGNQCSVEFNLIYRWHSTISVRDEQWTISEFKRVLGGKDPATAGTEDVIGAIARWQSSLPSEPEARTFGGLNRLPNGTFSDDDLVKILTESIEDLAGSFGANRVPRCMKAIEVLGVLQARSWNLGTLNEFRQFVGLTKHATFEDINPDPEVAARLQQLYDSPDSVEMYPGLVVEKTKAPMNPGSGLCGNMTMTTAILSDAVALVRGDRFCTVDYTPKLLTNWGFSEANYDTTVDGGHIMYKLILRAFPNHFVYNSIYAHFPFATPPENQKIMRSLGMAGRYSWEVPQRQRSLVIVESHKACTQILNNQQNFSISWGRGQNPPTCTDKVSWAASNRGIKAGGIIPSNRGQGMADRFRGLSVWEDEVGNFFTASTERLLKEYSYSVSNDAQNHSLEVDIVRDVVALALTNFVAALWSLPIGTRENAEDESIYSEQELCSMLMACFSAMCSDNDMVSAISLRWQACGPAQQLWKWMMRWSRLVGLQDSVLGAVVEKFKGLLSPLGYVVSGSVGSADKKSEWPSLAAYGDGEIKRILKGSGCTVEQLMWGSILPTTVTSCGSQVGMLSQAIDYYLGEGKEHLAVMYALAHEGSEDADKKLTKYFLEGVRLGASVGVYRDVASDQATNDLMTADSTEERHDLKPGSRVLINLTAANRDGIRFPVPETFRLDRPTEDYLYDFGWGAGLHVGRDTGPAGLAVVFKKIVGLRNLRRAPGARGQVKWLPAAPWGGQVGDSSGRSAEGGWTGLRSYMTADQSAMQPVPSTLRVRWDE